MTTVCIIGAGPSGLSLAWQLERAGISFDLYERNSDVGGLWDINNPGSPMYESAHFISSKTMSGFSNAPMPNSFSDYPSHKDILKYIRAFTKQKDLYQHIRFNSEVNNAEQVNGQWVVSVDGLQDKRYETLVCANGVNWHPKIPKLKGQENFSGEILHAQKYKKPEQFRGKKVLIVGAGNSGCDIACDAAQFADQAFISMRRGYHFVPKHIFGTPSDVFDSKGPEMPMWIKQKVFPSLLKILEGNPQRLGLPKPDHKIFESHPILNSQMWHYLRHGDIKVQKDIDYLDGNYVVFKDGQKQEVDLILLATGYRSLIPYLKNDYIHYQGDRPQTYLNLFSRDVPNLITLGFMETNSGAYALFDYMAHMVTQYLLDKTRNPQNAAQFEALIKSDDPDLSGGVNYVKSDRHANYINKSAYMKYLKKMDKRMKWTPLDKLNKTEGNIAVELAAQQA